MTSKYVANRKVCVRYDVSQQLPSDYILAVHLIYQVTFIYMTVCSDFIR